MDSTCDVFLTKLPKNINEVVIRNLFSTTGKVLKVKIIDDKRNENQKLCFVGFRTMDEALEAVRIADNSDAFGEPIRASITKKCLEGMDNSQTRSNPRPISDQSPSNRFANIGRGRGLQSKPQPNPNSPPAFKTASVKLTDIKLKLKELIDVEIIDLKKSDTIMARPVKSTENSKIEITDLLSKINSSQSTLALVDNPHVGCCYLAKWDDDCYYRAELLEIRSDSAFTVAFIDEGTSGDIVTEIRQLPIGPLQQYPKQFVKLSLGCPDDDDLKEFILQESEGKIVKIYWLGEFHDESVPLVNLFFDEDEVMEKYSSTRKRHIRKSFSVKFDDLPTHRSEDRVRLRLVQSMFKGARDFVLQFPDSSSSSSAITLTNRKSPSILPLPGDLCIYEKRVGGSSGAAQLFRCLIKRRQLFSFDIQLIDSGESISNVNIDNLYTPDESHRSRPPNSISCELDRAAAAPSSSSSDSDLLNALTDDAVTFNILQYTNNNRYIIGYNAPPLATAINQIHEFRHVNCREFVGTGFSVNVSHVVSPINFYVQIDKDNYNRDLQDIQEKINMNYSGPSFKSLADIRINQAVVAPFIAPGTDSELFRARVLGTRKEAPQVHVLFIDYGNDEWVQFGSLVNVDEELADKPGLAFPCQLNVDIRKEAWAHAVDQFFELIGLAESEGAGFRMQVISAHGDKFVVDLVSNIKGSLTSILVKSGTCVPLTDTKPICNGDAPKCNGFVNEKVKSKNEIPTFQVADTEDKLIQKINDLEKRISILESFLLKK